MNDEKLYKIKYQKQNSDGTRDYEADIKLSDNLTITISVNEESRNWAQDMRQQLLTWRGVPHPDQVNAFDESVKNLTRDRGVAQAHRPNGRKEKSIVKRAVLSVQREALVQTRSLILTCVTLSMLRHCFVIDKAGKRAFLIDKVMEYMDLDVVDKHIEQHFAQTSDDNDLMEFPILDDQIPGEYMIALSNALVEVFPNLGIAIGDMVNDFGSEDESDEIDDMGFHDQPVD